MAVPGRCHRCIRSVESEWISNSFSSLSRGGHHSFVFTLFVPRSLTPPASRRCTNATLAPTPPPSCPRLPRAVELCHRAHAIMSTPPFPRHHAHACDCLAVPTPVLCCRTTARNSLRRRMLAHHRVAILLRRWFASAAPSRPLHCFAAPTLALGVTTDPEWCPMILSFPCRSSDHQISSGSKLTISISHLLLAS